MKLQTDIAPRRDGTVIARPIAGGEPITFQPDEFGDMVADVEQPEAVAALLATGNFYPADEGDLSAASALITAAAGQAGDDGDGDEEDDDGDDFEGDDDAPLIEEPKKPAAEPAPAPAPAAEPAAPRKRKPKAT